MTIDMNDMLNSILNELSHLQYVHPGDIPNIDLYMDQVTTFMDEQLASTKRYKEDKILTKTMINNYTKNNLLPPPVKKKYSREHMLLLIFIYYFKSILSIKDIETVLKPLTEKYFSGNDTMELSSIYEELCHMEYEQFIDTHKKYYHPSNSYIFLYGDMNLEKCLKFINEEYLADFDRKEIDAEIKPQEKYNSIKDVEYTYSISEKDDDRTDY